MDKVTASTIKAMTPSQLSESLLQQEMALREHAVKTGFDSSASREEFLAWANATPYAAKIELLSAELKRRPSPLWQLLASKAIWLIALVGAIVVMIWLTSSG